MSENNQANVQLPEKSVLWLSANIGAGVLLVNMIVKFIGSILVGAIVAGNIVLLAVYAVAVTLLGSLLGAKFGVNYALNRSRISPDKIGKISLGSAAVPFGLFLLMVAEEIYMASEGVEDASLSLLDVFGSLILFAATYHFVKKTLSASLAGQAGENVQAASTQVAEPLPSGDSQVR